MLTDGDRGAVCSDFFKLERRGGEDDREICEDLLSTDNVCKDVCLLDLLMIHEFHVLLVVVVSSPRVDRCMFCLGAHFGL